MKKLISAILLLLAFSSTFAQIQITGADMPVAGRVCLVYVDTLSHPDLGTASPIAQNWNYLSLNNHYPQVASYSPITSYQAYGTAFPGANLFTFGYSWLYSGFYGGTPITSNATGYMFWRTDSTGFYICGFRGDYGTGETNINENPQEMLMRAPFSLDSSYNGVSRWTASIAENPFDADTNYICTVIKNLTCDAFGQMVTSLGTFNVLRIHEYMISLDSISITWGSTTLYKTEYRRDTTNNYYFWTKGLGYPVAIVKADAHETILRVEHLTDTLHASTIMGTVYKNNGVTPVESGKAELITKTALDQLYGVPETVPLTPGGHFQFANVIDGGNFLVQARPDTTDYPYAIPTYYGDAAYWMGASTLNVLNDTGIVINTVTDSLGYTVTGNGSISGTVWQNLDGSKSMTTAGGVKVTLEQNPSGAVVRHALTDENGHYSFKNLPPQNFRLHVDIPALPMDSTYYIFYSAGDSATAYLDFYYDSLYVHIYNTSGIDESSASTEQGVMIFPNPAHDWISVAFHESIKGKTDLSIYDMCGRALSVETLDVMDGENIVNFDIHDYPQGFYFIRIVNASGSKLIKFIKQ